MNKDLSRVLIGLILGLLVLGGNLHASSKFGSEAGSFRKKTRTGPKSEIVRVRGSRKSVKRLTKNTVEFKVAPIVYAKKISLANRTRIYNASKVKSSRLSCFRDEAGSWKCFVDCVGSALPPETILTCAEACGNREYATCATCLGVGLYVVITCGASCYPLSE